MQRYWVFDPQLNRAVGPFSPGKLKGIKGFSLETLVAPDGAQNADAWKPAGVYEDLKKLYPKPPPLPGSEPPMAPPPPIHAPILGPALKIVAVITLIATIAVIARTLLAPKPNPPAQRPLTTLEAPRASSSTEAGGLTE